MAAATSAEFPEFRRVLAKDGGKADWQAGDRLVQKDLAASLHLLADDGPDAFYKGKIADQLVAEMKAGGGLITKDDLAGYQANVRAPIHGTYRGYNIYGPPPPSSGGTCLVEMLNMRIRGTAEQPVALREPYRKAVAAGVASSVASAAPAKSSSRKKNQQKKRK